jgi:hypothetical protein
LKKDHSSEDEKEENQKMGERQMVGVVMVKCFLGLVAQATSPGNILPKAKDKHVELMERAEFPDGGTSRDLI